MTPDALDALARAAKRLPGFPFDEARDPAWLHGLAEEFQAFDLPAVFGDIAAWLIDHGRGEIPNYRSYIRKWLHREKSRRG